MLPAEDIVRQVVDALRQADVDYMLVGSFSSNFYMSGGWKPQACGRDRIRSSASPNETSDNPFTLAGRFFQALTGLPE